jgi:hypothetical protein
MTGRPSSSQSKRDGEGLMVQELPRMFHAMRYRKDGGNLAQLGRFIQYHGGDFRPPSSANMRFDLYRRKEDWDSGTLVFPGDWIVTVAQGRGGVRRMSHSDMCSRFVHTNGRPLMEAPVRTAVSG